MDEYPRLQNLQRMLGVIHGAITQAERGSNPGVTILVNPGGNQAGVYLRAVGAADMGMQETSLAEVLCPNYGGSVPINSGTEAQAAGLDHLETRGYELIGELPDPQERIVVILEGAIRAVQRDDRLDDAEKKKRVDLLEEAKWVVRTFAIEVAKAVWRGDLPPI